MTTPYRMSALVLIGVIGIASVISDNRPLARMGAPLLAGAHVPPDVRSAIERSCKDCHSDATDYPWYSYVAPVSWLISRDVRGGRERLNFSRWSEYPLIRRERYLSEIANQVQDGGMPIPIYVVMHHAARLSKADVAAIFEWTQAERMRLISSAGLPTTTSR